MSHVRRCLCKGKAVTCPPVCSQRKSCPLGDLLGALLLVQDKNFGSNGKRWRTCVGLTTLPLLRDLCYSPAGMMLIVDQQQDNAVLCSTGQLRAFSSLVRLHVGQSLHSSLHSHDERLDVWGLYNDGHCHHIVISWLHLHFLPYVQ